MTHPEKQDLINEIEGLAPDYYGEVLNFMHFLKKKQSQNEKSDKNPLLQFAGQLSDTDLSEPEDPIPTIIEAF